MYTWSMKYLAYVIPIFLFCLFASPFKAQAIETGIPFGGFVSLAVPCTCSPPEVWIEFTPFWSGEDVPATGALVASVPGTLVYEFFQIAAPGTFELGSYVPGAACLVLAPNPLDPCIPLPALGTIEYTGTSSLVPFSFF